MEDAEKTLQTLRAAWRARAEARQAVTDWMNAEARTGRLRSNGQAPGWPAYEAAESALADALRTALDPA